MVAFIPRPTSAAHYLTKMLSHTLRDEKDLYALLIFSRVHPYNDSTIEIAEALSSLAGPFGLLRFEFSSSNFYSKTLGQVMSLCMAINQNISQLFNCAISPPEDLKARFARFTGALDERFVGDTMAVLSLVEQALKTGDPLLAVLPTPLVSHCLGVHEKPMGDDQDILSVDVIRRRDFRKYCVVLSAFVGLLSGSMSSSLRSKGR
ncbi:hypothetical protein LTR60_000866 [Cryomyces antarcticus]|nr:hypothetical protein LTR60_000866 [Cryomyces antarcticus]